MDREELLKRVIDFFDPFELVAILGIPIEDVVEAFSEEIEEHQESLMEFMTNGH